MGHASYLFPTHLVFVLEAGLLAAGVLGWLLFPSATRRLGLILWAPFRRLGRHPSRMPVLAGFFVAGLVAGSYIALGPPIPNVHDEQSYLFLADTLASGRLSNPTPPAWRHFEAIHIIVHPSYASKYPPAPAIPLAVGQLVIGHPAAGTILAAGLFAAALGWFLNAFLPASWAAWGAVVAGIRLGLGSYWGHGYWGGFVAAIGGLLVWGGLRRVHDDPRPRYGVVLAAGVVILATSRPWEGLVAALPAGVLAFVWLLSSDPVTRIRRVAVPAVLVLVLGGGLLGIYDRAVTGSATTFPYAVHDDLYSPRPLFVWQEAREPSDLSNPVLASFWGSLGPPGDLPRGWPREVAHQLWWKSSKALVFLLGVPLLPALPALGRLRHDRWIRWSFLTVAAVFGSHAVVFGWWPHYSAPIVGLLFLLAVAGVREVSNLRYRGRPTGRAFPALILVALSISAVAQLPAQRPDPDHLSRVRQRIRTDLEARPGRDLVLVPSRMVSREWLFNRADLQEAEVVWARSFGPEEDRDLLAAFPDRRVWKLLRPTRLENARVVPWSGDPRTPGAGKAEGGGGEP